MTVTPSLMKRWEFLSLSPANLKMAQVARPAPSKPYRATTVT